MEARDLIVRSRRTKLSIIKSGLEWIFIDRMGTPTHNHLEFYCFWPSMGYRVVDIEFNLNK